MKIFREFNGRRDMMSVESDKTTGELKVSIVNNVGENATTAQFLVRKDIAQVLIKTLFDGMKLEDPDSQLPIYKIEP